MEVTGSATQTIRVHLAACQQTEQDAVVAQLIKGYSYCNANTEISTGSKVWSSHS